MHVTSQRSKYWFNRFPRRFGPLHSGGILGPYWDLEKLLHSLLEAQMPVDTRDSHGGTPLLVAAKKGNDAAVKTLLQKGTDINAQN